MKLSQKQVRQILDAEILKRAEFATWGPLAILDAPDP